MEIRALAAVLVAVPGPAVTLVMKQSLVRCRSDAIRTALGVFSADLFWVGASVPGLTAVIVSPQPGFQAIRIFGTLYLHWLGARLMLSSPLRDTQVEDVVIRFQPQTRSAVL